MDIRKSIITEFGPHSSSWVLSKAFPHSCDGCPVALIDNDKPLQHILYLSPPRYLERERDTTWPATVYASMDTIPPWLQEHCHRLAGEDPELSNLNLNIRRLNVARMNVLCHALRHNRVLKVLNLTNSLQTTDALVPLCQWLASSSTCQLQILHLSYNRPVPVLLQVQGAGDCLGRALTTNRSLQELYLDHCDLGDAGCIPLAAALQQNATLRVLSLDGNAIGSPGAAVLQEALLRWNNVTLRRISLAMNDIPPRQMGILQVTCRASAGRRLLRSAAPVAQGQGTIICRLWPFLLARSDVDVVYFLLHAKPDLCAHQAL